MNTERPLATYHRLRHQPVWRLLAADNAPAIIALLQTHLMAGERSLPASLLHERIGRDLEALRAQGEDLPQTAQGYVADWLAAGYLERRLPPGATEEEYELSTAAAQVIRFLSSLIEPRAAATESRLAVVIQQLVKLAEETDNNPDTRIATLMAERARIDREITAVREGRLTSLSDIQALERTHEVVALADELAGDFRRVKDQFEQLNRKLRERIMDSDGHRGDVLDALFAGIDVIGESDAGRTFAAFWRLLTDPEQSATLDHALEQVLSRGFAGQLGMRERRFLLRLTRTLLDQGGAVHEVLQHFARSLKHFVQSREYLEQRRINTLLKEAHHAAIALKDEINASEKLEYTLLLTSSRVSSLAQWVLYDPSMHDVNGHMSMGAAVPIDLTTISALVAESEIDFRTLKQHIGDVLQQSQQASIADILTRFPAEQGLGSVVGYVALGSRHGIRVEDVEHVTWEGGDGRVRSAHIPAIYFLRDRVHELA